VSRIATALAERQATGSLSAVDAVVSSLVSAIDSAIAGLLDDGGAYVLLVPMPKKGLTGLIGGPLTVDTDAPVGALNTEVSPDASTSLVWTDAFSSERLFLGGNAHFLRTVTEALFDRRDVNRPRFTNDTYWGYAALVAGATDVAACLTVASYIDKLLGSPLGANGLRASRGNSDIVASGVSVRASERNTAAVIEWEEFNTSGVDDGTSTLEVTEYAVLRSEEAPAMTARLVIDIFPTIRLTEGVTGRYGGRVVKVASYDGFTHRYVDPGPLVAGTTYYYHVAARTRVLTNDIAVDMGYHLLSSAARYRPEEMVTRSGGGKAPDWWRTPSIARMIPALSALMDKIQEAIYGARATVSRSTSLTNGVLAALDQQIAKLDRTITEMNLLLQQLENVFSVPSAGVHVDLRTGKGNVTTLLGALTMGLSDFSDPDRPPFDNGDEYVTGAMVVVAAPNEAAFQRAWAILDLLFGGGDAVDPVIAGINSILAGTNTPASSSTAAEPSDTFGTDMSPLPRGTPDASC
jgi:hypothetical protein